MSPALADLEALIFDSKLRHGNKPRVDDGGEQRYRDGARSSAFSSAFGCLPGNERDCRNRPSPAQRARSDRHDAAPPSDRWDVCLPRKLDVRHRVMPLRSNRFDRLTPILWHKIANGVTESVGSGAGFYGKPYQRGAVIKNDVEYILFLRKPGEYRKTTILQQALSRLTKAEIQSWFTLLDRRQEGLDSGRPPVPTVSGRTGERLIRMFSFSGDALLDPLVGTGSTTIAAIHAGRNSVANEIEPKYLKMARNQMQAEIEQLRFVGPSKASILFE